MLLLSAAPAFAADAFDVKVRIEAKNKTLVPERKVTLADAPIIKDDNPDHACSGQAAIGALQAGSQGNWTGTWYEGLGYAITSILGYTPAGSAYFELWVDHKMSSTGICDHALKAGDSVLLFDQTCTYDPKLQGCKNPVTPLGVRAPSKIKKGKVGTLTVVDYDAAGKATPERGATVFINGKRVAKTDKKGRVHFKAKTTGEAKVYAKKSGHVRTETRSIRVVA